MDTTLETLPVEANRILNDAMQEAAGPPTAYSVSRNFSLYTREDPETRERYLVAVNKDKRERMEDTVTVLGEFAKPVDLGRPKGFPVPVRIGHGCTTLPLSLAPGEGTILLLGKHVRKQMDRKTAVRVLRERDRKAREKILRVLDGIEPSGGETSYARAMVCRRLAQNMMRSNDFGPALVWSEKAADYARRPDPASSGEAYECPRSRVPVAVDGDDGDWDDVAWTGLGESRFKTKWDEPHS